LFYLTHVSEIIFFAYGYHLSPFISLLVPFWYLQSSGHCIVYPSSIYGFWLHLWYLQTVSLCMFCPSSINGLWLPHLYLQNCHMMQKETYTSIEKDTLVGECFFFHLLQIPRTIQLKIELVLCCVMFISFICNAYHVTWFIRHIHYWNLQSINIVIFNRTNVLLPQVDVDYLVYALWFYAPKTLSYKLFGVPILRLWAFQRRVVSIKCG
jgi:hypothetical protein